MTTQFDEKDNRFAQIQEKEAEDLAQLLAGKYGFSYIDLSKVTIDMDALKILTEQEARGANIIIFQRAGKKIQVAVLSPKNEETQRMLKVLKEKEYIPTIFMVSETALNKVFQHYSDLQDYIEVSRGVIDVSAEKIEEFSEQAKTLDGLKHLAEEAMSNGKSRKVSDILEMILAGAIGSGASDIHIEPQKESVRMRLRLDGTLRDILDIQTKVYALILSRIKLVSGMKLNVHNEAQDGRFTIEIKDTEIEIRVSLVPVAYGESVVMRILNPESISVPLEELGIQEDLYNILIKEIKKPNGMLLTTGPTGSGKTTALYAFLKKIYTPDIKIVTLEDPIEYHLEGIVQTQVETQRGYTFADGLRAMLRQDPDVVMVGEIRDAETASIAINAALTGHLVFTTLHTNNAAGTIPRLIDLGVNPNILAPAINVTMAQRLIRKLCNGCKKEFEPSPEEREVIERTIESFSEGHPKKPGIDKITLWKSEGCEACNNVGYKGRTGIFEAILIDKEMEEVVMSEPSETEVVKASKSQGILNMQQDGILKVLNGTTSLEELQRAVEL